tara:strand:- start:782 stop:889 length:108 start_codon:yes stop_codon:yes gene_type:complete
MRVKLKGSLIKISSPKNKLKGTKMDQKPITISTDG